MSRAFPLQWPQGRPRTSRAFRREASFGKQRGDYGTVRDTTFPEARARLLNELALHRAVGVVLSTNVAPGPHEPDDPGAVLYVTLGADSFALPCDAYRRVADNVVALTRHLEATRQIERLGVASVADMLAAFGIARHKAAPEPVDDAGWWRVLRVRPTATRAEIEAAFRALARERHPDQPGGSHERMADLNQARRDGLRARGGNDA